MSKTLCKSDDKHKETGKKPKYICKKCGNKTHKEKLLCKPKDL